MPYGPKITAAVLGVTSTLKMEEKGRALQATFVPLPRKVKFSGETSRKLLTPDCQNWVTCFPLHRSLGKGKRVTLGLEQPWLTLLRLREGPTLPQTRQIHPLQNQGVKRGVNGIAQTINRACPRKNPVYTCKGGSRMPKPNFTYASVWARSGPTTPLLLSPHDSFTLEQECWFGVYFNFRKAMWGTRMYSGCVVNCCWLSKKEWSKRWFEVLRDMEKDVQK